MACGAYVIYSTYIELRYTLVGLLMIVCTMQVQDLQRLVSASKRESHLYQYGTRLLSKLGLLRQ